jgi:hypothetical protein
MVNELNIVGRNEGFFKRNESALQRLELEEEVLRESQTRRRRGIVFSVGDHC